MKTWTIIRWAILIIGTLAAMAAEIAIEDVTYRLGVAMAWAIGALIIGASEWILRRGGRSERA